MFSPSSGIFFIEKRNVDRVMQVETVPRMAEEGTRAIDIITPDLCDQTSWFQSSVRETVPLTYDTDHYKPADPSYTGKVWINPFKIQAQEGRILSFDGTFKYRPEYFPYLYDALGVPLPLQPGDYVNYEDKKVFYSGPGTPVAVSLCSIPENSLFSFVVQTPPGYKMLIAYAEIQFAIDVDFETKKQALRFEIISGQGSGVEFHEIPLELGLYEFDIYNNHAHNPLGATIMERHFGTRQDYTSWREFEAISNVGKNIVPAWGSKEKTTVEFPFAYLSSFYLARSANVGLRLYILDTGNSSGPLLGSGGSLTLYTKWIRE